MSEQEKIDQRAKLFRIIEPAIFNHGDTHYLDKALDDLEQLLDEAHIDGMKAAKSRVLRRTEIPKDAKNPTRDATVLLGEAIADIIDGDIAALTANEKKEK